MDLDLDQLAAAVLRLPPAERAELASRLLESLETEDTNEPPDVVAAAWEAEVTRREAEFEADPSIGIPTAEVFRALDAELSARRRVSEPGR